MQNRNWSELVIGRKVFNNLLVFLLPFFIGCFQNYDCDSRPKLVIKDIQLPSGHVGIEYNELLNGTEGLYVVEPNDSAKIPKGLIFTEQQGLKYLKGIPLDTGNFSIPMRGIEHGTQCIGRDANFSIQVKIDG
ncbi:MAG: hypothetical protein JXB49_12625 [Bacteroidales bacterium]|nr:hypothetical protein [Bacteroidales bacterium]